MTARTATQVAWFLWGLAMALEAAGILLWLSNHATLVDRFGTAEDSVPHVFLVPGYATVGAVIAARSRNRIGWLFLAFGLAAALLTFANPYYMRGTVIAPGSLPAAAAILESLGRYCAHPPTCSLGCCCCCSPMSGCRRRAGGQWPWCT